LKERILIRWHDHTSIVQSEQQAHGDAARFRCEATSGIFPGPGAGAVRSIAADAEACVGAGRAFRHAPRDHRLRRADAPRGDNGNATGHGLVTFWRGHPHLPHNGAPAARAHARGQSAQNPRRWCWSTALRPRTTAMHLVELPADGEEARLCRDRELRDNTWASISSRPRGSRCVCR
jgi:hypothetical protein